MRDAVRKLTERLPLEFRVLYRHFLLRVIDLESLSIEADIPRFLGQFAGVLILIDVFPALGFLILSGRPHLTRDGLLSMAARSEQSFLAGTMLIAGLAAVATWDNIFPDCRDVIVLGPLPIRAYTVLAAKVASSASLLGIGVLALNCGMGIVLPLITGGIVHFLACVRGILVYRPGRFGVYLRRSAHDSGCHRRTPTQTMVLTPVRNAATRGVCCIRVRVGFPAELWHRGGICQSAAAWCPDTMACVLVLRPV